jgi:hypothetical protein
LVLKVYFWGGQHHSETYAGGWVCGTFAAAVESLTELGSLCRNAGIHRPQKPWQAKPGRDEWEVAAATPGVLLFRNDEPTGYETREWQVVRDL